MHRIATPLLALAVAGCSPQGTLDERDGAAVVVTRAAVAMPESDHVPAHDVVLADAAGHEHRLPAARAAVLWPRAGASRVAAVDADARLVLVEEGRRRPLLDHVVGVPVVLDERRLIAARETEPGETDLWVVADDGTPPRAVAAAPGADDSPQILPDGRVVFISGRSGVASLWIVEASPGAAPRQLTNVGERPGALSSSFVPPPEGPVVVDGGALVFTDQAGVRHTIALAEVRQ
jgi:hypothetical protein